LALNHFMNRHQSILDVEGKRQHKLRIHDTLLSDRRIRPFAPLTDSIAIRKVQIGRFHQSAAAVSLYCTASSSKSMHPVDKAPFGYLYSGEGQLFALGVFQRRDGPEFVFIIPLHTNYNVLAIANLAKNLIERIDMDGAVVRFLDHTTVINLAAEHGFKLAKETPWHQDAAEEDESLAHSKIRLPMYSEKLDGILIRAKNFMQRNGFELVLEPLGNRFDEAFHLIRTNFRQHRYTGERLVSEPEDYCGLLTKEIQSLPSVFSYLGFIRGKPVSLTICDSVGNDTVSCYSTIAIRDLSIYFPEMDPKGSSALSAYVQTKIAAILEPKGVKIYKLGGSEYTSTQQFKISLGAEPDPTYWGVLLRSQII
jgi:hypothetical protein